MYFRLIRLCVGSKQILNYNLYDLLVLRQSWFLSYISLRIMRSYNVYLLCQPVLPTTLSNHADKADNYSRKNTSHHTPSL